MSRSPVLEVGYLDALSIRNGNDLSPAVRLWKLTNTRYIFAAPEFLPYLNQFSAVPQAFRYALRFNLAPKTGITLPDDAGDMTPQVSPGGSNAVIEFTDALPRVKLYANWITRPDDQATLQTLGDPRWDPSGSVLVSQTTNDAPVPAPGPPTKADPGAAIITEYDPKDIKIDADAKTASVLLYNDRIATAWRVWVDGKPSPLLRCNYIMRGVFLPAGGHKVEFKFQPSLAPLCVTLVAWMVGLLLAGYLIWFRFAGKHADAAA
jgi:hypothetical protein